MTTNRTILELKRDRDMAMKQLPVSTNRTILELKQWNKELSIYEIKTYQSHHTGIETLNFHLVFLVLVTYQSHHTGIETIIGVSHTEISRSYQSHHTGIETADGDQRVLRHFPTNRTILELKQTRNFAKNICKVPTNRTILELKLRLYFAQCQTLILPIAPYWN